MTNDTRTELTNYSETARTLACFGLVDSKGRAIGALTVLCEADFVAQGPEAKSGWTVPEGHKFGVNVQATRDGDRFGASQATKWFAGQAERDAYAVKRVSETRARYSK